jgi:hypothetical protein
VAAILDFQSAQFKNIHFAEDPKRNIQASFHLNDLSEFQDDHHQILT